VVDRTAREGVFCPTGCQEVVRKRLE